MVKANSRAFQLELRERTHDRHVTAPPRGHRIGIDLRQGRDLMCGEGSNGTRPRVSPASVVVAEKPAPASCICFPNAARLRTSVYMMRFCFGIGVMFDAARAVGHRIVTRAQFLHRARVTNLRPAVSDAADVPCFTFSLPVHEQLALIYRLVRLNRDCPDTF